MKLQKILLILSLFLYSCGGSNKSQFDNIPASDTTCIKEVQSAKKDFAQGKLVYCHYAGSLLYVSLRSENEMIELLNKYNISYKNEITSDLVYEGQTQGCYCEFMREKITKKHGQNFIDSLLNVSDSLFVSKNLLDTFYYAECDTYPRYPNGNHNTEFIDELQSAFYEKIKDMKGYVKIKNDRENAFVNVGFVVNKEGKVSDISFLFVFYNEEDEKYKAYFESQIKQLIEETKWEPATIRKQKVISDMNVRINLD